jgi:hypothetical protein
MLGQKIRRSNLLDYEKKILHQKVQGLSDRRLIETFISYSQGARAGGFGLPFVPVARIGGWL